MAEETPEFSAVLEVLAKHGVDFHYRDHLPKRIEPTRDALAKTGHHLLATKFGPLDVLGSIGVDDDYDELMGHTETVEVLDGVHIAILNLATLIEMKQKTARAKDNYMLEILREMQSLNPDRSTRIPSVQIDTSD